MKSRCMQGLLLGAVAFGCHSSDAYSPRPVAPSNQPVAASTVALPLASASAAPASTPTPTASAAPSAPVQRPSAQEIAATWNARTAKLITGHAVKRAPKSQPPNLHQSIKDPVFGSTVTRVTAPSQWPKMERIRHYYSKANPFNADGSRALMFTSDGSILLYDTRSWNPLGALHIVSSDPEIQWHPSDPNAFYYMDFVNNSPNVRAMFRYDVNANRGVMLHDFSEYDTARGKLEGNMDADGRYYALIGNKGGRLEAFVYDIANDKVSQRVPVTEKLADDWISVSPSGKYVVLMGSDRSRVYDIQMNHLRDLPKGSFGHADLCRSADGRDLMVYDGADHELDSNRNINIADLGTGAVRIGVRIGWGTTPHVSCRNLDLPGWALISTQGPDDKYPNHDFEIFWLKLDGSGDVRRLAHHHSDREEGGYFAEQHAVTNRDGTRVLFASNWGGSGVSDYLVEP